MRTGLLAEFETPEALIHAARALREKGYRELDAFTPFPVRGLDDLLGFKRSPVNWMTLPCALFGGVSAYLVQWWCNGINYPLNVGGRPLQSAPAFVPITFEMIVLFGGVGALTLFFILSGLPELYSPVFDVPGFERATIDRFFLGLDEKDPKFDRQTSEVDLSSVGALSVSFAQPRAT